LPGSLPCISQNKIPFGDITYAELLNQTYKNDPGADAVVLSDDGIASLNYTGNEFFVELVRDVRIRIVNSNGFDHANVEIPFLKSDDLIEYKASTFNIRNGEITETPIPRKSFILDDYSSSRRMLKFSFPDVHAGSVIEYSYTLRLRNNSVYTLVPWIFQRDIPVVKSSLTLAYPEYFTYKQLMTGLVRKIQTNNSVRRQSFYGETVDVNIVTYSVKEMPALKPEPFVKSDNDLLTRINFELSRVNFPHSSMEEITPSYETLTQKLMERDDFGVALQKTVFLKKKANELTNGISDDMEKFVKIYDHVSKSLLWNGVEDFTASGSLKKVYDKKKGNSADINMILISMLRNLGIVANPVILSTRSNGSLNKISAMIQQFNYLVAQVEIGDNVFLVDATDPDRPYNLLPFDCLNESGWLVDGNSSRFVDLTGPEKNGSVTRVTLKFGDQGELVGQLMTRYSGYYANELRDEIRIEGLEGYKALIKNSATEIEVKSHLIENLDKPDSSIVESFDLAIRNGVQYAHDEILFNPFFTYVADKNDFYQEERVFPIDFGSPYEEGISIYLSIPDGYSVSELPKNATFDLGKNYGKYSYSAEVSGRNIVVNSLLSVSQTVIQASEYQSVRDFFSNLLHKQADLVVLKKSN
jgi:hypothetical protein